MLGTKMKKGREAKAGVSGDMLACFPSRPHWGMMPKPICSPGQRRRHVSKSTTLLWAIAKSTATCDTFEPSSPKVTCAGQIKVTQSNWQCMMGEIENNTNHHHHHDAKLKKKSSWAESMGFRKREIMQFLTCLRAFRFDLHCFGSFPSVDNTTEDEDDEEEEGYRESHAHIEETLDEDSRDVLSKWFMRLEENQDNVFETRNGDNIIMDDNIDGSIGESCVPPPNALLLMRCSSAPAKSWTQENREQEKEDKLERSEEGGENFEQTNVQSMKMLMEKEDMVVMTYGSDFYKMSSDIAKETWIVGPLRDPLSKSRSWRT